MRKAFTLIELVVAVALLAMMISFASLIFDMSIDTHRTAMASAEIMQKLQAITGQLNADFKGLRWTPGGRISFTPPGTGVRADRIVFFANGDFQSTGQYNDGGGEKTVAGNTAIIFYGQAANPDPCSTEPKDRRKKILVRRQTILTSDTDLEKEFGFDVDEQSEYYESSLSQLAADENFDIDEMMEVRPLDINEPNDLVTYMAEGVDDFTIQYVGEDESLKPFNEWRPIDANTNEDWLDEDFDPKAFKFTFTLYDSKGVLEDGKTFTHIVYLGD